MSLKLSCLHCILKEKGILKSRANNSKFEIVSVNQSTILYSSLGNNDYYKVH